MAYSLHPPDVGCEVAVSSKKQKLGESTTTKGRARRQSTVETAPRQRKALGKMEDAELTLSLLKTDVYGAIIPTVAEAVTGQSHDTVLPQQFYFAILSQQLQLIDDKKCALTNNFDSIRKGIQRKTGMMIACMLASVLSGSTWQLDTLLLLIYSCLNLYTCRPIRSGTGHSLSSSCIIYKYKSSEVHIKMQLYTYTYVRIIVHTKVPKC